MTISQANQLLVNNLQSLYDQREATAITGLVLEHITGLGKVDRILKKNEVLTTNQVQDVRANLAALMRHKPVQYVIGEGWFGGMKFVVNDQVLIPRPETEELVAWAIQQAAMAEPHRTGSQPLAILDVGTGSGCVAVLLKTKIPYARLYGCDISVGALAVARLNALQLHADVHFLQIDFLSRADRLRLPEVDLIVSNPPYIPEREKSSMALHVTAYEPSLALFVPNDDPLVFYQALGIFAQEKLTSGGCILVEVHSPLALRAKDLLVEQGFAEVEVRKDILGNDRFLKAVKR